MLVAGPSVHICDECVEVCAQIMRAESGLGARPPIQDGALSKDAPQIGLTGPAVRCALCRMPAPLEDAMLIVNRGALCVGCIGEIEATLAERRNGPG